MLNVGAAFFSELSDILRRFEASFQALGQSLNYFRMNWTQNPSSWGPGPKTWSLASHGLMRSFMRRFHQPESLLGVRGRDFAFVFELDSLLVRYGATFSASNEGRIERDSVYGPSIVKPVFGVRVFFTAGGTPRDRFFEVLNASAAAKCAQKFVEDAFYIMEATERFCPGNGVV